MNCKDDKLTETHTYTHQNQKTKTASTKERSSSLKRPSVSLTADFFLKQHGGSKAVGCQTQSAERKRLPITIARLLFKPSLLNG